MWGRFFKPYEPLEKEVCAVSSVSISLKEVCPVSSVSISLKEVCAVSISVLCPLCLSLDASILVQPTCCTVQLRQ